MAGSRSGNRRTGRIVGLVIVLVIVVGVVAVIALDGKAKAWAQVLGISSAGITAYIAHLTPVLLTNDTLVTNHGYNNGKATSLQSVLATGTAVLVDGPGRRG